jgi:hypothetical protein
MSPTPLYKKCLLLHHIPWTLDNCFCLPDGCHQPLYTRSVFSFIIFLEHLTIASVCQTDVTNPSIQDVSSPSSYSTNTWQLLLSARRMSPIPLYKTCLLLHHIPWTLDNCSCLPDGRHQPLYTRSVFSFIIFLEHLFLFARWTSPIALSPIALYKKCVLHQIPWTLDNYSCLPDGCHQPLYTRSVFYLNTWQLLLFARRTSPIAQYKKCLLLHHIPWTLAPVCQMDVTNRSVQEVSSPSSYSLNTCSCLPDGRHQSLHTSSNVFFIKFLEHLTITPVCQTDVTNPSIQEVSSSPWRLDNYSCFRDEGHCSLELLLAPMFSCSSRAVPSGQLLSYGQGSFAGCALLSLGRCETMNFRRPPEIRVIFERILHYEYEWL